MLFRVSIGKWSVSVLVGGLPDIYGSYKKNARLVEEFDLGNSEGQFCFTAVGSHERTGSDAGDWPELVIAQRYYPFDFGFDPGALIVPETDVLFVGAGERLLAYDLSRPKRLWVDDTSCGFWRWRQHQNIVLMSAELELAAWSVNGKKLWTAFVEPPWDYTVRGKCIELDVMGKKTIFDLAAGPQYGGREQIY